MVVKGDILYELEIQPRVIYLAEVSPSGELTH